MAGTIGTNVLGDEQALSDLTQALLNDIKNLLEHHWSTKKDRLLNEMYEYIKGGGDCSFKYVPKQFAEKIEQALQDKDIPYHTIYGADGDVAFLVREKDKYKLLNIQKEVFMTSTDYFAETKASSILQTSKNYSNNEKNKIIRLSFEDEQTFKYIKQQLYNNNIVSGALDFSDTEKKYKNEDTGIELDVKGQIYVSSEDYFNETGSDISKVELEYATFQAFENSTNPDYKKYHENKNKKIEYDDKQLKEFARLAKKGERAILGDITKQSGCYLEAIDNEIAFVAHVNGSWKTFEITPVKSMDLQDIITICSKHAQEIANMKTYSEHDKETVIITDETGNPIMDENENPKTQTIQKNNYKDWKDSKDTKITEADEIEQLIRKAGREQDFDLNAKVKSDFIEITTMLQKINKQASYLVEREHKDASSSEKYSIRQEYIESTLKNPDNEFVKMFMDNPNISLSTKQKEELLANILVHYQNKHEKTKSELILDELDNNKELLQEVLEDEKRIRNNEKNTEKTKQEDKTKEDKAKEDNKDEKNQHKEENQQGDIELTREF